MSKYERKFLRFFIIGLLTINFRRNCNGISTLDDPFGLIDSEINSNGRKVRLVHYDRFAVGSAVKNFYYGKNIDGILKSLNFEKPTVFYIHGFRESPSSESVKTVADAYLNRDEHNFILVDWSDYAYDSYLAAFFKLKKIARYLSKVFDRFVANDLPSKNVHIVGHSMGAQLAGFIGNNTSFKVPRITGLDPASPGYYQLDQDHLNPSNAEFVDVIHTDGGLYGAYPSTGTADCYANGGSRPQPGCPLFGVPLSPTDLCAHWRSWRIWAESISNGAAFLGLKCDSSTSFLIKNCQGNRREYCGFEMPKTTRGNYYFVTNARTPFGRGVKGIYPN